VKKTEDMFIRFDRIYKLNGQTPHDGIGRALRRIARLKHSDAYKMINAVQVLGYRVRYCKARIWQRAVFLLPPPTSRRSVLRRRRRCVAGAVVAGGISVYDSLTSIDIRISESTTSRTVAATGGSKVGLSLAIAYESSLYC